MSDKGFFAGEVDRLIVQLAESERLRTEAFQACETMRQERDGWKAGAEAGQQQATQLRKQVEALEASLEQEQGVNKTLLQQLADADAQILQFEKINDTRDELEHQNKQLQAQLKVAQGANTMLAGQLTDKQRQSQVLMKERDDRTAQLQSAIQHMAELQAQLDAAAVTPAQQPNYPCSCGTAERLKRVRRVIGHVLGWYTCTDWFDEVERVEAWEQVGELLGRLQREAD